MRKVAIFLLSVIISYICDGQEVLKQGGQKTSGATSGQVLKWNGTNWVPGDDNTGSSEVEVVADSAAFRAFSLVPAPKAVVMADKWRGGIFYQCTDCTADQYNVITDSQGRKWKRDFDDKTVNVTWYGAIPNDLVNDSLAVQLALNSVYNVFCTPGVYRVGQLTVTNPKEIFAKGVTFQLVTGLSQNTRILTILGSNISVIGCKILGKISDQNSEFSHGIAVGKPTSDVSSVGVSNIRLSEITVEDVRGDGIIVTASGSAFPYSCENIILDNITVNNCLRNGISVINARGVRITNVKVSKAGLFGMNLEPDVADQKGDGMFIAGFRGPSVAFGHHLAVNNSITFQDFYIDGTLYGSTPTYTTGFPYGMTGLNVRQVSNLTIRDGVVKKLGGYGLGIGNTTTDFSNVLIENVTFDSTTLDSYYGGSKMLDQTNALSDSSFVFKNCVFNGRGYLGAVGAPTGLYEDCVFTGFDRFLLSSRGGHCLVRCSVNLDLTGAGDFLYDGFGGFKVRDSYISCNFLVRGQNTDNVLFEMYNNDISYAVAAYSSMGSAPGARFILQNNKINGSYIQDVANGGTVFHDKVLATGSSATTIVLPVILLHPKNVINVLNESEGRTVTIAPQAPATVNGATTATSVSTIQITGRQSGWHFKSDGVGSVSNGLTIVGSTAEQGGRYTHNTLLSGRHLYSLNQDSLTNLRFLYNTNGAFFSTRNGATGIKILGDVSSLPGSLGDDESFFATSSSGAGGLISGDGRLVIGSRKGNLIGFTTDRINFDMLLSSTEVTVYRTGAFENNIWNKNTGYYTNLTSSFVPVYKEKITNSGRIWTSSGGDVPIIIGGSEPEKPPLATSDNGAFIVTSGGGTAGTVFQNYGSLVFGSRYANPMYWVTSKVGSPKMNLSESGLSIGNGMTSAADSVDITGTLRLRTIPAKSSETAILWRNGIGQIAYGGINPSDLGQQSATNGQVLKWNGSIWAPATDAIGTGATDLTFTGSASPYSLNSSTGTGVTFAQGTGTTLSRSGNELTVTTNLSTGVSGGQSVIGGTLSGNSLTLVSTSNATKGNILFGNSVYTESTNRLGLNTTTPTALIHLAAGTTAAGTAPMKFTAGTNLTTAEAGAAEWDGTRLYLTQTTGPTRKTVAYLDDISSDGNGIYSGSGTVPNGTIPTLVNDLTWAGTDNIGAVPAFRITTGGTAADKGLQTWRPSTGNDSLMLHTDGGAYRFDAKGKSIDLNSPVSASIATNGASISLFSTTGTVDVNAADRTNFTGTDLTFSTSAVGSSTSILQPMMVVSSSTTITTSKREIVCIGQTGDINVTLNYTPFSIIGGTHTITVRNPSPYKVTLIRGGSWDWRDVYGIASTTNKVILAGQSVDLVWVDVAGTDYWLIQPVVPPLIGVQEETSATVTWDGRSSVLYIPSSATTTTINLPEIVASAPTINQVTIGATFRITIDRSESVSIARSGSADLIKAHNYPTTGDTSIQTTGSTFFSQTFTAVGPNLWIVN